MMDQIMAERRLLNIRHMVTSGAGIVGIPAYLRASRSLGCMMDKIMAKSSLLYVSRMIAAAAGIVFIPAFLYACRSLG